MDIAIETANWRERINKVLDNAQAIREKLKGGNLSPDRRACLEFQLRQIKTVAIPRLSGQNPRRWS